MRRRTAGAAILAVAAAFALTACTTSPAESPARPVTAAEAEVLAAARFHNFDAETRTVSFDVDDSGSSLHVEGWFDYATRTGYATLTADGTPNALLLWDDSVLAAHAPLAGGATGPAPLPVPDAAPLGAAWEKAPLSGAHSRLHSMLQVVASLGSDRPDNPLLLRQSGALYLGDDTIDGTAVTEFAGPLSDTPLPADQSVDPDASTTRFWVDADGVMRRAAVRLGDSGSWQTIDLGAAAGVDLGTPLAGGTG